MGCRRVQPKAVMLRWVAGADGSLRPDVGGGAGRGAYVCRRIGCLEAALRRRAFPHALRRAVEVPPREMLVARIREEAERRVLRLVGLARRARKVVSGREAVEAALRAGRVGVLLLAADAGADAGRLAETASRRGIPVLRLGAKEVLGEAVGAAPRTVIGVADVGFTRGILNAWEEGLLADGTEETAPRTGPSGTRR